MCALWNIQTLNSNICCCILLTMDCKKWENRTILEIKPRKGWSMVKCYDIYIYNCWEFNLESRERQMRVLVDNSFLCHPPPPQSCIYNCWITKFWYLCVYWSMWFTVCLVMILRIVSNIFYHLKIFIFQAWEKS